VTNIRTDGHIIMILSVIAIFFDPLGWLLTGDGPTVIPFCPITLTSCCVYIVYHSVVSVLFYRNDSILECDLLATAQLLLMLG